MLRKVPPEHREFTVEPSEAATQFGFDEALLAELAHMGLPCGMAGEVPRYDFADLHFLALRLGTAKVHLWAMRRWASTLTGFTAEPPRCVRIAYVTQLGQAVDMADCVVRLPGGRIEHRRARHNVAVAEVETTPLPTWPALPPQAVPIAEEIGRAEFYALRGLLRCQPWAVRSMGVVECHSAARLLVDELTGLGLAARLSHGLLLSLPCSTPHAWAEVECEGRWTPIDPLLISMLRRFGGLDAQAWPTTRSPGATLLRVGEPFLPLVSLDGEAVTTTFLTSLPD